MNWEEIAKGAWPDNDAFARLPQDAQLREVHVAIALTAGLQEKAPEEAYRLGTAVLHLLDSRRLRAEGPRASLGALLGVTASNLGRREEAIGQLRRVIDDPPHPDTESQKLQALTALGGLLSSSDTEEAGKLLQRAHAEAIRIGDAFVAANASVSLGALQRRAGDLQSARQTLENGINELLNYASAVNEDHRSRVLAMLHGNLGNLLTDNLRRPEEANTHYEEAIRLFDSIGDAANAAKRWFHRVSACLAAAQYDKALALFEASGDRIAAAPKELANVVSDLTWMSSPKEQWPAWEQAFERLLRHRATAFSEAELALLAAARILPRAALGDSAGALRIAEEPLLRHLPEYGWRGAFTDLLLRFIDESGRLGLCWHLPWVVESMSPDAQVDIRERYQEDRATLWLAAEARRYIAEGRDSATFAFAGRVPGVAGVPAEPPSWLAIDPLERTAFSKLRSVVCPRLEAVRDEYQGIKAAIVDNPALSAADIPPLQRAVLLADLLGQPERQVISRIRLSHALAASPGGVDREVLQRCGELLEQAKAVAYGLPREQIRVHLALATLLKEAVFGEEDQRLALSLNEARAAYHLARKDGSPEIMANVAVTMANTLSDVTMVGEASLDEARGYLEEAIAACQAAPDDYTSSGLHNSLGKVYLQLSEYGTTRERLKLARSHLETALTLRWAGGVPVRILLTLSNLLGVLLESRRAGMPVAGGEILSLVDRVCEAASRVEDRRLACGALLNTVLSLRSFDSQRALALGLDALVLARQSGFTRILVDACQTVGRVYRHRGEMREAAKLFQEAVTALDSVRGEGGDSRHRATLSERYRYLYEDLQKALTDSGAASDEVWWAIECQAGQTLLENMERRGVVRHTSRATVSAQLAKGLPPDCLVIQLYRSDEQIRCLSLGVIDGVVRIQPLEARTAVERLTDGRHDKRFTPANPVAFAEQLSWLGKEFIGPVMDEIETKDVSRIAIVAQGIEANIAWHAVPIGAGSRLGERFDVVQLPSASLLANLVERKPPPLRKAVFVACDPDRSLQLHVEETLHAFSALPCKDKIVLTDQSRTVNANAVLAACEQADVLHFSGHGVLTPGNLRQSGILLSDGLLSIATIEQSLSSRVPSIVVLSSCDSAAEDSHLSDAPTLTSTFLQAGARAVIGAAWPVPDAIAADTMFSFYERISAMGAVIALNEARRQLDAKVRDNHSQVFKVVGWD